MMDERIVSQCMATWLRKKMLAKRPRQIGSTQLIGRCGTPRRGAELQRLDQNHKNETWNRKDDAQI